jgi:hypothetical protein
MLDDMKKRKIFEGEALEVFNELSSKLSHK